MGKEQNKTFFTDALEANKQVFYTYRTRKVLRVENASALMLWIMFELRSLEKRMCR